MSAYPNGKVFRRETIVAMLRAALSGGDYRFARQTALAWLAAFPGDLEVTLLQAQGMLAEGKRSQVIPALELISRKDPLSTDAYRLYALACQGFEAQRGAPALSCLFVLDGAVPERTRLEPWGMSLRQAWLALEDQNYAEAGQRAQDILQTSPDLLLAAAIHLLADRAAQAPLHRYQLADLYRTRWPECLLINLTLAEAYLELGKEPEAVRLLHLCAANDSTGQVARRLWGENHPYRSLWTEDQVILFDQPIPAGVAARMGWNRLPAGQMPEPTPAPTEGWPAAKNLLDDILRGPVEDVTEPAGTAEQMPPLPGQVLFDEQIPVEAAASAAVNGVSSADEVPPADQPPAVDQSSAAAQPQAAVNHPLDANLPGNPPGYPPAAFEPQPVPGASQAEPARRPAKRGRPAPAKDESLQTVNQELGRLAGKLKQPAPSGADGRQPIYVIFTSREGLAGQYGPQTASVVDAELRKLANLISKRPGWGALFYYPDDAACTGKFGLTPVNPRDPWKMKNALADLDGALGKRGERIGALLIVGGDPVVPFHRLPNPTEDADAEILSDSPYATLDANYFVPEWPVGRLPGEKGPDAGLLLEQLRLMQRNHAHLKLAPVALGLDWWAMLKSLLEHFMPVRARLNLGYTAAVWRRSSLAVFRPIGAPHTVLASPPEHSGSLDRERVVASALSYYNLHGLEDSPAWYGQRDPLEGANTPDYPVALTPADLRRNGHAPRIIFSEACYGGHILGKGMEDSLALKFLSIGTRAVVASTAVSYGSVNTPLIAADLLGNLFWQHLKSGRAAGEALMQAKVDLVREMNRRQGFLDGEDQKSLISFVLYGDPLSADEGRRVSSKAALRARDHLSVKVAPDRIEPDLAQPKLSKEALLQVKAIVAEYLPGADYTDFHLIRQAVLASGRAKSGANEGKKNGAAGANGRVVVAVSKTFQVAEHTHRHFMRITLDEGGNPIKTSLSR